MFQQLGVIGCGLMGGSFALAARRAGVVRRVVGYSQSPASVERARQLGVIDAGVSSALEAARGCDLVLVAVPVGASQATFDAIRPGLSADALVMDVGSTKADVIAAAQLGLQERFPSFVPAHPIAGKERAGVEHADADLFAQRSVVLTPLPATLPLNVQRATELWTALGAKVLQMTPSSHDRALSAVSHLPHLLAFAFVQAMADDPEGDRFFELAGPGFRDFTRIAAGDPALWRDVLLANRDAVLAQSAAFRRTLDQLEAGMRAGDGEAVQAAIAKASARRAAWNPDAERA